MKVTLVARVSMSKQDADLRMNELRQWAKIHNHTIVDEFWIYESATVGIEDRKEFMKIFDNPKGEALVLNKLDRLTRNFESIPFFERYFIENWDNYKLISLDLEVDLTTAVGKFVFRTILTIACLEAEQMKERQKASIERAKKEGKFKGRKKGAKGVKQ